MLNVNAIFLETDSAGNENSIEASDVFYFIAGIVRPTQGSDAAVYQESAAMHAYHHHAGTSHTGQTPIVTTEQHSPRTGRQNTHPKTLHLGCAGHPHHLPPSDSGFPPVRMPPRQPQEGTVNLGLSDHLLEKLKWPLKDR